MIGEEGYETKFDMNSDFDYGARIRELFETIFIDVKVEKQ